MSRLLHEVCNELWRSARSRRPTTAAKHGFQWLLVACLAGTLWAANDAFVGKWKLNPAKSKLTDQMKVKALGANKYAITFNGGDAETVVADGTDQPAMFDTTLAISAEGPHNWRVVRKKQGRTLLTGIWQLSADGNTLDDALVVNQSNGSPLRLHYVYKRTAGQSGFPGTWESTSEEVNSVYEIQIQPYQGDGLSFITPAQNRTLSMKFDGKDYRTVGPDVPSEFMSSGRRASDRTLALTDRIKGKVMDSRDIMLSFDRKTLTVTVRPVGQSTPNILVFDRE